MLGMTSMTDPKGETTYYEYDSSGRLSVVLDHNTNVAKAYCYNYQGQSPGCPIKQVVYARIERINYTSNDYVDDHSTDPWDPYYHEQYSISSDARISFYADSNCTIPKALPAGLTATVAYTDLTEGAGTTTTNHNFTIPAGTSNFPIAGTGSGSGQFLVLFIDTYKDYSVDPSGITTVTTDDYSYKTVTHTGSDYMPWFTFN